MDILHTQLYMFLTLALDRDKWFAFWPSCFTLSADWVGGRAGLILEVVWMLRRREENFPSQKPIDDSLDIQPTALPSCQAGSCLESTEASHITHRMNTGVFRHPEPHQSNKQDHTLYKVTIIFSICLWTSLIVSAIELWKIMCSTVSSI